MSLDTKNRAYEHAIEKNAIRPGGIATKMNIQNIKKELMERWNQW